MPEEEANAPTFFATPAEFRAWLEAHHETATELWVGFHKKATGRPSMTGRRARSSISSASIKILIWWLMDG